MELEFIHQPSAVAEELFGNRLTTTLARGSEDGSLNRFQAAIGFLKRSGLGRISDNLQEFRRRGGNVSLVVGIDHGGTSAEGLALAFQIADEVHVFHDETGDRTFHPKLYLLFGEQRAVAWIGSSNLTQGGLYTNYELLTEIHFDLERPEDLRIFNQLRQLLDSYQRKPELCRHLNQDLLDQLIRRGYLPLERRPQLPEREEPTEGAAPPPEPLFGRGRFAAPPPISRSTAPARVPEVPEIVPDVEPAESNEVEIGCFWKVLSANDVSPSSSPGQIIIPIAFRDEFPPVTQVRGPDAGGHGRQWECLFSVVFTDVDRTEHVTDVARFIIYEPRTGHPRPNTEARFTFRNTAIFNRIQRGDMLVFQRLDNSPYAFRVRRLTPNYDEYTRLYPGRGRHFGPC